VKLKEPGLKKEFVEALHPKVAAMAVRFDTFCQGMGLGEAIVTCICRTPKFYVVNGLTSLKFSWHFVGCAVDLKSIHLTADGLRLCEAWFVEMCPSSEWEFKNHRPGDPGSTAPHLHLAYRDFGRRRQFSAIPDDEITKP
jgi:hypothetical protein